MIPRFKVWNTKDNKMHPVCLIRTNADGSTTVNATEKTDDWNPVIVSGKWKEGELLMSTGLSDRENNEVYEDDILQDMEYKEELYRVHNNREVGITQLVCISPDKCAGWTNVFNRDALLEMRIVGNVHSEKESVAH